MFPANLLTIIRGAGSDGKTTLAQQIKQEGAVIICPDDHPLRHDEDGKPRYEKSDNETVFRDSHALLESACEAGVSHIIFAATNIALESVEILTEIGLRHRYAIQVVKAEGILLPTGLPAWNEFAPPDVIASMRDRYQSFDPSTPFPRLGLSMEQIQAEMQELLPSRLATILQAELWRRGVKLNRKDSVAQATQLLKKSTFYKRMECTSIPPELEHIILVGAFRYYLGRNTAAAWAFCEHLKSCWEMIGKKTRRFILAEIERERSIREEMLGDKQSQKAWNEVSRLSPPS